MQPATPVKSKSERKPSDKLRVAVIEDHKAFREGLSELLSISTGFYCAGTFSSIESALLDLTDADVLLLDIGLPGKSGIEGIPLLKEKFPSLQIVMMTVFEDDHHISRAIMAGANGYILKRTPASQILQALKDANSGGMPLTPIVAKRIALMYQQYAPTAPATTLSTRELEVLQLLSQGLKIGDVAEKLFLSPETVRNHTRNIYEKLHVHSKSEAVAKAIRQGLV
ncbi:MAG: response regulator transcription factor [Chloroherpetonaceae bacterium]|nr:response regulator transcription factor [Chloroherpetonaceae bacterium]